MTAPRPYILLRHIDPARGFSHAHVAYVRHLTSGLLQGTTAVRFLELAATAVRLDLIKKDVVLYDTYTYILQAGLPIHMSRTSGI